MLSGVVCPREAKSIPISEAVRYRQMGESVLLGGERCLRFKVDICEMSVTDCGSVASSPAPFPPKLHLNSV